MVGFYAAYQVVRGAADREVAALLEWCGDRGGEPSPRADRAERPGIRPSWGILISATSYTYWFSQFAVVGLTLLYVSFRHYEASRTFVKVDLREPIGLVGYVLMPTVRPGCPEWGFTETLADYASVNHGSGLVAFAAKPYAAMRR